MIFILLSIKTRIETKQMRKGDKMKSIFLSYYPLKQGLKPNGASEKWNEYQYFYPTIH